MIVLMSDLQHVPIIIRNLFDIYTQKNEDLN